MKDSKYYKKMVGRNKTYNSLWLSKLLISIIIVLVCLILCNFSSGFRNDFKEEVLEDNMKFSDFSMIYNKFIGGVNAGDILVNGVVSDIDYLEDDGRYKFNYGIDSMVEVLMPGIIVFDGEKEGLGNTIIIQGNDGVDIWYSGVTMKEYSLYDYISKGDILGISNDVYVTVSIYNDGELLDYEEYI